MASVRRPTPSRTRGKAVPAITETAATPDRFVYQYLSDAGMQIANLIKADTGDPRNDGNVLSRDGKDTFDHLRDALININTFGGMITLSSQASVPRYDAKFPGYEFFQRPHISLLAHASLEPLFTALAMEDNVAVYGTSRKLQPVTFWNAANVTDTAKFERLSLYKYPHTHEYAGVDTWLNHMTEPKTTASFAAETFQATGLAPLSINGLDELIAIDILWTKTTDIGQSKRVLAKYFVKGNNTRHYFSD